MSRHDRAAQFSPFAALTGHRAALAETERHTDRRPELDESMKTIIDEKLQLLEAMTDHPPTVTLTYFKPDPVKSGGAILKIDTCIRKIDRHHRTLILENGSILPVIDLLDVAGDVFDGRCDY